MPFEHNEPDTTCALADTLASWRCATADGEKQPKASALLQWQAATEDDCMRLKDANHYLRTVICPDQRPQREHHALSVSRRGSCGEVESTALELGHVLGEAGGGGGGADGVADRGQHSNLYWRLALSSRSSNSGSLAVSRRPRPCPCPRPCPPLFPPFFPPFPPPSPPLPPFPPFPPRCMQATAFPHRGMG